MESVGINGRWARRPHEKRRENNNTLVGFPILVIVKLDLAKDAAIYRGKVKASQNGRF